MPQSNLQLKRFLNSQHLYTGLRITAGVLIPAIILYHFGQLGNMMGIPLGALFIALPDNPGPTHHRVNGMTAGIILNFLVLVIAGYSIHSPLLVGVEIAVFSFLFSMFAVYGTRADGIGLIALVAFILAYGSGTFGKHPPVYTALYFAAGGAWYALLALVFTGIQPYKPVQQMLGEYLVEVATYLESRARFYDRDTNLNQQLASLFPQQVVIQKHQNDLREMLFKTRIFVKESTNKGRRLVMIFLESADLLERIVTAQQDYRQLHRDFDDSDMLDRYRIHILFLAHQLEVTGTVVQAGGWYSDARAIDEQYQVSREKFFALRAERLNAGNMEAFIRLRHILYSLADLSERIKRLQGYTEPKRKVSAQIDEDYVQHFISHQDFSLGHFTANLSLQSNQFRHAIRLTIAMLAGYALSLLFPLGHSYWILLAIATILKPAFSTSRTRNMQRVAGTLIGVTSGFLTLYFTNDSTILFTVMFIGMLVAYTTLRLNYLVSTAAITLYIVLSFHFLTNAPLNGLLLDRLTDTLIGGAICIAAAYLVLPKWEYQQIEQQISRAITDNARYFKAVKVFLEKKGEEQVLEYKIARKAAFIAMANAADGLQRMLNEPKRQQRQLQHYHQLIASSHMLTSYIASLGSYAVQHEGRYNAADLKPMLQHICRQFDTLSSMMADPSIPYKKADAFPVSKKIQEMLQQRRREVEAKELRENSTIRHEVSLLKSIADILQLISSVLEEQTRVFYLLHHAENA